MPENLTHLELIRIEARKNSSDIPLLVEEIFSLHRKNKYERLERFAETLLKEHSAYHTQKERMAHAIFLIQIALLGTIISSSTWPPTWLPDKIFKSTPISFVTFSMCWLLIHIFMRWQLRNRRWAAIQYAGVLRSMRKWATSPPTEKDIRPYFTSEETSKSNLFDFLDFLIPRPDVKVVSDVEKIGFPQGIVDGLHEQESKRIGGTGALFAEGLITYGSIIIYLLSLSRIFNGVY